MADLKLIYRAVGSDIALETLDELEDKWVRNIPLLLPLEDKL